MEAILLFEKDEQGPENAKVHGDEITACNPRERILLFPDLLNGEALPVKAVCHQAGRAGIALSAGDTSTPPISS